MLWSLNMETDREWIGVGTPLVRCPPHRSELAEVPYTARTSGNGARAESLRVAGGNCTRYPATSSAQSVHILMRLLTLPSKHP